MKPRPIQLLFIAVLVLSSMLSAPARAAWSPPTASPIAAGQHPRLMLTPATIPTLQSKLSGASWKSEFQAWIAFLDRQIAATTNVEHAYAANYAFVWLTYPISGVTYGHTRQDYGNRARALLLNGQTILPTGPGGVHWGYPLAYDWLNAFLSTSDKASVAAWLQKIDQMAGPFLNSPGGVWNTTVVGFRMFKVMAGLATYGDSTDNTWALAAIDKYDAYFRGPNGVSTSESLFSGTDGGGGEGYVYWSAVDLNAGSANLVWYAEDSYRTANGIDLISHYGTPATYCLRYQPKYLASLEIPWATPYPSAAPDNLRHVIWKSWASSANDGLIGQQHVFGQLAAATGVFATIDPDMAALATWMLANRIGPMTDAMREISALPYFILGEKTVAPKSAAEVGIPLSAGRQDGMWFLRTGWSMNDSFVAFSAPKWMTAAASSYTNPSIGGFEVYRKGPQVIREGEGGHDWGNDHAGPSNMMIFPDRSITARTDMLDTQGGMRWWANPTGADSLIENSPTDLLGTVRQWLSDGTAARDVDVISVDLTKAYDSTIFHDSYNPARLSSYVREFVYFRPAVAGQDSDRLVILDRVTTTDTKFEKEWLFHTGTEPMVNGTPSPGPSRGITGVAGKWTYRGATQVIATNTTVGLGGKSMDGKTWLTPLLPANRLIVKVGGPNSAGQPWRTSYTGPTSPGSSTDSHEFESPYGQQGYVSFAPSAEAAPFVGSYRVEIIPSSPALTDTFLNVVEVGDSNANQSPVELINGTGAVGARVGNRIAIFTPFAGTMSTCNFVINQAGTYRLLLADLAPGAPYDVTIGSQTTSQNASSSGTLYLNASVVAGTSVSVTITGIAILPPQPPGNVLMMP